MNRSIFETILGAAVVVITIGFFSYGYNISQSKTTNQSYSVTTYFSNAGGIEQGADVRISGVVVGNVTGVSLDNKNYKARVDMNISNKIALPSDTVVEIASDGFIGGKYIRLKSGNELSMINKNGVLDNAKDVVTIEQMLGKLIFLTME